MSKTSSYGHAMKSSQGYLAGEREGSGERRAIAAQNSRTHREAGTEVQHNSFSLQSCRIERQPEPRTREPTNPDVYKTTIFTRSLAPALAGALGEPPVGWPSGAGGGSAAGRCARCGRAAAP